VQGDPAVRRDVLWIASARGRSRWLPRRPCPARLTSTCVRRDTRPDRTERLGLACFRIL